MNGRWRSAAAGAALLALAAGAGACGRGEGNERRALQSAVVERRDLRVTAEATGLIEPITSVEVKSKASGEVLRLYVQTGDRVPQGALLAEIDPRDVRNAYNQAVADLEVAKARVEIAEANLERSRDLFESQVITRQEFEAAKLEYANAQATLVKAQTNLELAEQRLGDVTIRAPIAGTILQKNVEEGQVIQSAAQNISGGTTLFIMADLARMQVRTLVDETDMGRIVAGQPARVSVEAFPGRTFSGQVEKIEPQAVVQQNITMFPVIVHLDNREGLLRPGMNAEVEILIAERPGVLTAPNNAIVYPQDVGPAAMVLGLDPDKIRIDRSTFATLAANGAGAAGRAQAAAPAPGLADEAGVRPGTPRGEGSEAPGRARAPGRAAAGEGAASSGEGQAPGAALRGQWPRGALADSVGELVRSGQISRDSAQALMRRAWGARARQGRGTMPGGVSGMEVARPAAGGPAASEPSVRSAVVFVVDSAGGVEPRPVLIGLNDWDYTEIVRGVAEGEQIALIGAAQLQARQQEWIDRIRERRGGLFPGQPGPPPGAMGGRR